MPNYSNIILITVDALRTDRLGFMGCGKNLSPNIDNLAKDGIVFSRAFASGSSTPYSFPAILSSTYPLDYQGPQKIEKPRVLLSEVLKEAGYLTAAFHANPFLSGVFGYNRGWDYFEEGVLATGKLEKKSVVKDFLRIIFKELTFSFWPELFFKIKYSRYRKNEAAIGFKVKAAEINKLAQEFIVATKNEKKPFFLWVHYMDVHGPYLALENYYENRPYTFEEAVAGSYINHLNDYGRKKKLRKFLEKYIPKTISLYEQGICCFDQELGKLLDFFKKEGIDQNSVICLTSDHGEELFERGGVSHFNCRLYNELLQVPLIIKIPGWAAQRIDKKVSLVDLAPTILNLVGLEPPAVFKGKSLFDSAEKPLFHQAASHFGVGEISRKQSIKKFGKYNLACQFKEWKYISDGIHEQEELYNLENDPQEKNNLGAKKPEIISQMRARVEEFKKLNPPLSLLYEN